MSECPPLTEWEIEQAYFIAKTVRNAMEDFHVEHLTDKQMAELNPIIRNAIVTALHVIHHEGESRATDIMMLLSDSPAYWEKPELSPEYVKLWEQPSRPEPEVRCRHCNYPIFRTASGKWHHRTPSRDRGCRAALFHYDKTAWGAYKYGSYSATPPKEWKRV